MKRQLKGENVDWEAFAERAKLRPKEINQKRLLATLKKTQPKAPFEIIQTLFIAYNNYCLKDEAKGTLVDANILRYACCFNPHTSSEIMSLLLDNISSPNDVSLDVCMIGSHLGYRRYSIEALIEFMKRNTSREILHHLYSTYRCEFYYLSTDQRILVSTAIIHQNPSLISYLDVNGNTPLHHLAARLDRRDFQEIEMLLREGLERDVFSIAERGGLMIRNNFKVTPLQHLVRMDNDAMLNLLNALFAEKTLTLEDVEDLQLLHLALKHKSEKISQMLIFQFPTEMQKMSKDGELPLHLATRNKLNLDLVQMIISDGITNGTERSKCGGLCIENLNKKTPLHYLVEYYGDADINDLLTMLLDAKIIEKNDLLKTQLLVDALQYKAERVATLIIQHCPQSLSIDCSDGIPLHIACQRNLSVDLIQFMIEEGNSIHLPDRGGLMKADSKGVKVLQLLVSKSHAAFRELLKYLFERNPPLLEAEDIIDYSLDQVAIRAKVPETFDLLYEYLPDDLKKISVGRIDDNGQSNVHLALTNRHRNPFIMKLVNERIRFLGDSGLFVVDNFGDIPMNILLRPHYPLWNASLDLIRELINMNVITKDKVLDFNLLHKIAQWPKTNSTIQKAKCLLTHFPEAISLRDKNGNLPIHCIVSRERNWSSIHSMLAIFVKYGVDHGFGDSASIGGLLVEDNGGDSTLTSIILHEASKFQPSNDPSTFVHMINFFSDLLAPLNSTEPFLKTAMNLFPVKVLPNLIDAFDNVAYLKDNNGRLLLHIAASKGLELNGIEKIISANQAAILEIDPLTGCYPFMLAAADCYDMNTIFMILQSDYLPIL